MTDEIVQIKVTPALKLAMALAVLVALGASWFVVRWYLGNTIAIALVPDPRQLATAEMALRMAPQDPFVHWRLGNLIATEMHSDQIGRAVAEYEKAASLSPNDYRFWMDFGSALEQSGDAAKAEQALRTAVKLAPAYAYPRWHLGNLLLRSGRYPEAFAELRLAGAADDRLQPQLFNLAWQVNRDDFNAMLVAVGDAPETRAQFSEYLAARGKVDDALRLWNSLSSDEKKQNRATAESMVQNLVKNNRFHLALAVWNDIAPSPNVMAQMGQFTDPGFENGVINTPGVIFGWQLPSLGQVQIGVDATQARNVDGQSLRLVFQVREALEAINVAQVVVVQPNTEYDFECYFKTEKLVSAATPTVYFTDATDGTALANSGALPAGDNDWQRLSHTFKTGPKTEAIRVSINRSKCDADSPVCPIYGTAWYDDFNLKSRK